MHLVGKLENGYLQLVRIIFLVLATLALIVSVVLGVRAAIDYNAKAAAVPSDISVNASAFRLAKDEASADESKADATDAAPADKEKSALLDGLHAVLLKHGKKIAGADFTLDKDDLEGIVDSWMENSSRGADFAKAQTKYFDDVLARADVAKQVNGSPDRYFQVVSAALIQFETSWTTQHEAIAEKKAAAEQEASAKRLSALQSISVVAGAVGLFITLVLSLIMFRVDRSIRQMANARVGG